MLFNALKLLTWVDIYPLDLTLAAAQRQEISQ